MLEGLDRIAWHEYSHAYGTAEDVPDQIRALASDDKSRRDSALNELWGNIHHQGTVYSASHQAVPFLIELLSQPSQPQKHDILILLRALASGSSYIATHEHLFVEFLNQDPDDSDWKEERDKELHWVQLAHDAAVAGWPEYLRLLTEGDSESRQNSAYMLAVCTKHKDETLPVLRTRLRDETNTRARASIVLTLASLHDESSVSELFALMANSGPAVLEACVAVALAVILAPSVPIEVCEHLSACLVSPQAADADFKNMPWSNGGDSIVSIAGMALRCAPQDRVTEFVPQLFDGLNSVGQWDTGSALLVEVLLSIAFRGEKAPSSSLQLSELQRNVLGRLVESDAAWHLLNSRWSFEHYELPSDQNTLLAYLNAED